MQDNNDFRRTTHSLTLGFVCISGVIGFVGFCARDQIAFSEISWGTVMAVLDALYQTVQLYALEGPGQVVTDDGRASAWLLSIARFLAPVSLAGYIVSLSESLWRPLSTSVRLRRMKGHVVIFGCCSEVIALAHDVRRAKQKLLILTRDEVQMAKIRAELGEEVPVLIYPDRPAMTLMRCRILLAQAVFLFEDDHANLELMARLRQLASAERRRSGATPVRVFVRLQNMNIKRELIARSDVFKTEARMQFEPINIAEIAARQFFHSHDHFLVQKQGGRQGLHWICLGWNPRLLALIEQLVKVGPFPDFMPPKVTILAPDSDHVRSILQARFLDCGEYLSWDVHVWSNPGLLPDHGILAELNDTAPVTGIVIAEGHNFNADIALMLEGEMNRGRLFQAPIWLGNQEESRLPAVTSGRIAHIGPIEEVLRLQTFLGALDMVAVAFHDVYLQYSGKATAWEDLDENLRSANRRAADHAKTKLEAMGFGGPILALRPELEAKVADHLEELARAEHESWSADRLLNGWTYGDTRSDENRIHPNLKPYDALTDFERSLDRRQVEKLSVVTRVKTKT